MIKVLYFINNLKEAGAQKHLLEVIKTLDRDEFQPCLALLDGSPNKVLDNIPVINLGVKRIYDISGIKGLFKLIRLMKRERFDIVHSYLFSENILGSIAAKIANVPVILTSRRDTGMLYKRKFHYIWAYRLTNLLVDKIICVSEAVKKAVIAKEKVSPEKIEVIYNGVDVNRYFRKSLSIGEKESVVGMIANFSWIKGHKDFIDAAEIVLRELPNTKFLLVGDGTLRADIEHSIHNTHNAIQENMLFLGTRKDIPELLSIMDVSVNASYSEGMSNTILQSMAAGVPVVATAVDGNLETVVDGETGILVPPKNPQAMSEAIIKILKDKGLAKKMGENSRKVVEEKFTNQIMLGNMEDLYKRLLKPRVAFIFSQFPCYDETFILREMNELKAAGLDFVIYSIKPCRDRIVQEEAEELVEITSYLPLFSIKLLFINLFFALRHPLRYWGTFLQVFFGNLKSHNFFAKSIGSWMQAIGFAWLARKDKVFHAHGEWATFPATHAYIIAKLNKIPFSFTGHAHDIHLDTTMLAYKIKKAQFVTTCTADNKRYLLTLSNMPQGESRKKGQTPVVISKEIRGGQFLLWGRVPLDTKIVVNYHGVDLERFMPQGESPVDEAQKGQTPVVISKAIRGGQSLPWGTVPSSNQSLLSQFKILSVGSLLPCKGFDILIEACKILRDKGVDFECTICGGGRLEKSLKSQVTSLKLEKEVKFTGYITQDKLIPLYRQTDVFALPLRRKIHWGIPNVLLEAMASKVPVITVALPSTPELIEDGKTGFIIPEENPKALAETIIKLHRDSALRERVGNLGYEIIAKKFNVKKNSQNLISLFSNTTRNTKSQEARVDKILNVLYIIPNLELGGAERVVINLAKGLDKARYNPLVSCLNQKGEFAKEIEQGGIRVIALNKKGKFDIGVVAQLMRVIKENQIDIVNTHLWGGNFWGRIAARLAGVKVIVATEHNTDVWKSGLYFMFDRLLSKWTDRIIAVSNSVKEFYISKGIDENKIEVIYNGIEVNQGESRKKGQTPVVISKAIRGGQSLLCEFGIKSGEKVVAVIGRLVPQKGHKYLFEALHQLDGRYNIKLLVVGDGPLLESLKSKVRSQKLSDKVVFAGLRKDVKEILGIIDILVMPSIREGLPMVALEAMAQSVPVIATKVGGVPELVRDNETGILVEPNNRVALKEALGRLIEDKGLAQRLGENAKRFVQEKFNIKEMLNKTQALYEDCLIHKLR